MNGMMVFGVHIKVDFSRRQNMGDTQGQRRPGLGSRGYSISLCILFFNFKTIILYKLTIFSLIFART